ncbi:nucleoside triphosphate pyrophosphohydrolase [Desulfohalovibrio reitneri]|uniref:nucleoside triphosphate pyrophosphohydrolase n=1 Tax=Desulfohalovibrio reitneri TaxID=1307759 RepID=UPI0004A6D84D|nr:nucleoside triphosphate pyrophosphohydrolase [Desulfohalovibrio reitneri]
MNDTDAFASLLDVIQTLIGPDGCPWDRDQTPQSLCDYVIEESFELVEAVRSGDMDEACEEVGDVFFLMAFMSLLARRDGHFGPNDALSGIAAKMVRRHPHVFADTSVRDQDELLKNWEAIKRDEKSDGKGRPKGVFDSLPKGLPPLLRAYRIHSKAARNNFTWESDEDLAEQLSAERRELDEAVASGDRDRIEEEYGDLLFTLVEHGRRLGVKANAALDRANRKFLGRFEAMEEMCREKGLELPEQSMETLDALWREAKKSDHGGS